MTRQRDLEASTLIREQLPLLVEALSHVGHMQTKSRGTLGGREIAMRDFPTFYMTPDIAPAEILT
jgi:CO/xanthine dehydrogenase FAD-binding subunit